jgi:hypothetical protein
MPALPWRRPRAPVNGNGKSDYPQAGTPAVILVTVRLICCCVFGCDLVGLELIFVGG